MSSCNQREKQTEKNFIFSSKIIMGEKHSPFLKSNFICFENKIEISPFLPLNQKNIKFHFPCKIK